MIDVTGVEDGVVAAFQSLIETVYMPALKKFEEWGELDKTPQGRRIHRDFMDCFRGFMDCLSSKFTASHIHRGGTCLKRSTKRLSVTTFQHMHARTHARTHVRTRVNFARMPSLCKHVWIRLPGYNVYLYVSLDVVGAHSSVCDQIILAPWKDVNLTSVVSASDCIEAAENPDFVAAIEETITQWCGQIEKVS